MIVLYSFSPVSQVFINVQNISTIPPALCQTPSLHPSIPPLHHARQHPAMTRNPPTTPNPTYPACMPPPPATERAQRAAALIQLVIRRRPRKRPTPHHNPHQHPHHHTPQTLLTTAFTCAIILNTWINQLGSHRTHRRRTATRGSSLLLLYMEVHNAHKDYQESYCNRWS